MSESGEQSAPVPEESFFSELGIYFCGECKNMMAPSVSNGPILQFICKVCGPKEIDFTNRNEKECMLYSKQLHSGSKQSMADINFIFDPTMPRINIECPECELSDTAVYFLTPDEGERKIIVKLICASATETTSKCGNVWDLDEEDYLYKDIIRQQGNLLKEK